MNDSDIFEMELIKEIHDKKFSEFEPKYFLKKFEDKGYFQTKDKMIDIITLLLSVIYSNKYQHEGLINDIETVLELKFKEFYDEGYKDAKEGKAKKN